MAPGTKGIRAGKAFVELYADNSRLVRGLRLASRRIKAFGANVRTLGLKMAGLTAMALAPMALAAKAFSSMGDAVAKMSKRTGVSVEALSELRFVASQTGTEFGTLENAFRKMQRSIYDAGRGLSTQTDALADLGLEFRHLDGLLPIDQFKLLADRIGKVEDPTKKAAIAMSLMGRTGTNLLPMFAQGAAGIEKLQQEARRLGLTMSVEDAKAAEDFTDAMDKLGKVMKMGVFRVGASMAKKLESLADKIAAVGTRTSEWVDKNRELAVVVAKVAATVFVGGIAIAALGTIIGGLGTALGLVVTVLKTIPIVLTAILSPLGLVATAAASMGAVLATHTDQGKKALGSLAKRFISLKDDAEKSWRGIGEALARGDIAGAAKIMWLTLKMEWARGIKYLSDQWFGFKAKMTRVLQDTGFAVATTWTNLIHTMKAAWINGTAFIKKAWAWAMEGHRLNTESTAKFLAKTWARIKKTFDDTFDLQAALQYIDEDSASKVSRIMADRQKQNDDIDAQRTADLARAANENNQMLAGIEDAYQKDLATSDIAHAAKMAQLDAKLQQARNEWQQALDTSKQATADAKAGKEDTPGGIPGLDLKGMAGAIAEKAMSVVGTFNAEAISGLGVGDNKMDKLVATGEQTAANTKTIAREARNGGMVFA